MKQLRNKANGEETKTAQMKNNRIEQAREYHQKKIEELGIEKQPFEEPKDMDMDYFNCSKKQQKSNQSALDSIIDNSDDKDLNLHLDNTYIEDDFH